MHSRTTSAAWVKGIVETLGSAGLDVPALLAEAAIDPMALTEAGGRIPTERISRLWRAAAARSGDEAVGLAGAHTPRPGTFGIVGYTMLSNRSLLAGLQCFARYLRLVSDAASIELETRDGRICLKLSLFGGDEGVPRQRVEYDLLTILAFCRWAAGRPIAPTGLWLAWPEPADPAPYRAAFRCELHFGAAFSGLGFASDDLEAPLPAFDSDVSSMHDRLARQRLAALDDERLSARVREEIARLLPQGVRRRERVAQALGLSDRTLQRRLREERVSFDELLDATRRDIARDCLQRPGLSVAEASFLLGFADQSAFFRACRRWFGTSPRRVRTALAADGADPPAPANATSHGRQVA